MEENIFFNSKASVKRLWFFSRKVANEDSRIRGFRGSSEEGFNHMTLSPRTLSIRLFPNFSFFLFLKHFTRILDSLNPLNS